MWLTISKVVISAGAITFASWLAGKKPALAGFIIAMIGVPVSYLFFAPFFLATSFF